jgi:hypothetical protein
MQNVLLSPDLMTRLVSMSRARKRGTWYEQRRRNQTPPDGRRMGT